MIYIPSKGRPNQSLFKTLPEAVIVVEPCEFELYKSSNKNEILTLNASNQGIAFARNFILSQNKAPWFWMLDDDITCFKYNNKKTDFYFIQKIVEAYARKYAGFGQMALEYDQIAWSSRPNSVSFNSYCDVAVYINAALNGVASYDSLVNLKEDRDFTLQVLSRGYRTARFNCMAFKAPENGSNKGGLFDDYRQKTKERDAVMAMSKKWPHLITPQVKKNGRFDCKINWARAYNHG